MTWTLTLDQPTPSLNTIHGNHWSTNSGEKSVVGWMLMAAMNRVPMIPKATGKRKLTITRHGKGSLDRDNLIGGCKWLIDAIKGQRLILDDDAASIDVEIAQVVSRKVKPHTVVTLEDMP